MKFEEKIASLLEASYSHEDISRYMNDIKFQKDDVSKKALAILDEVQAEFLKKYPDAEFDVVRKGIYINGKLAMFLPIGPDAKVDKAKAMKDFEAAYKKSK
ncbi:MAG TPA: hypothetical protein PLA71_00855 [Saccharofermentans sp.]|nr:hypothetical protein [Saccharofermentans sp.]